MNPKLLLLPLLLFSCSLFAYELKTFDLQHRSAEEMTRILQPMVENGGAISGSGYTLIIRSSPQNLRQLEQAIGRLDKAPRMLRITVDQRGGSERSSAGGSLSGNERQARIQLHDNQRETNRSGGQQLQVMEGYWATIRSGQSIPQTYRHYQRTPTGERLERHTEYRTVESGVEVRPRLSGQRVTLEVRPFQASPTGRGAVAQQQIITTVSGRLGEWITLGGINEQQQSRGQGLIYSERSRRRSTYNTRIKVELANP